MTRSNDDNSDDAKRLEDKLAARADATAAWSRLQAEERKLSEELPEIRRKEYELRASWDKHRRIRETKEARLDAVCEERAQWHMRYMALQSDINALSNKRADA